MITTMATRISAKAFRTSGNRATATQRFLLGACTVAIGVAAAVAVVSLRGGSTADHDGPLASASNGYQTINGTVPPDALNLPYVLTTVEATSLVFTVANVGPEASEDGKAIIEPELRPVTRHRLTFTGPDSWVEEQLGVPQGADPATFQPARKEYSGGVLTTRLGDGPPDVTQAREGSPIVPRLELTPYGAAALTRIESSNNHSASEKGLSATADAEMVDCLGEPCVRALYSRDIAVSENDDMRAGSQVYHVGDDNVETAEIVYDASSKLVHFYRLTLNGVVTHEYQLEEIAA